MTFVILFIFALVLSTGIYLGVQSYFDKRDAGKVQDRLLERAKAGVGGAPRPSRQEALFEGGSGPKNLAGCGKTTGADAIWAFIELPSGI